MISDLADRVTEHDSPLLTSMRVTGLFGRYDYVFDVPTASEAAGRLLLLHGDNGSGKTTVLALLWNLLSPSNSKGHRSYLARTPFSTFSVAFSNDAEVQVSKQDGLLGTFEVRVRQPGREDIVALYEADDTLALSRPETGRLIRYGGESMVQPSLWIDDTVPIAVRRYYGGVYQPLQGQQEFEQFLAESNFNPLLLADDRSLYSDDEELERLRDRLNPPTADRGRKSVATTKNPATYELKVTITRVNDWLRTLTLRGNTAGSAGANTIYRNVLYQLAAPGPSREQDDPDPARHLGDVHELLSYLRDRSPRLEEFELVPRFDADEFDSLLGQLTPERRPLAQDILVPYLGSLRTRYEALEPAERLLRTLLGQINNFLTDKRVTFGSRDGLKIVTDDGVELDPASLSSGERQLAMLLFTTVLAGRDSRLFIIDEPELSLGVEWQRDILESLLTLTLGSRLQFVVATHSLEVITGQPEALVELIRK